MSTFKSNQGDLDNEDLAKLEKFWSKKQFRTWGKKELEKDSTKMQRLLFAMSKFSLEEIQRIRKSKSGYPFKRDVFQMEIYIADKGDFEYAMSIVPKTFFKTECPNR